MENDIQTKLVTETPKAAKTNKMGLVLSLLIVALVASGGVYYWQHNKVKNLDAKVSSLNSDVAKLKQQLSQSEQTSKKPTQNAETTPALSSDEQVIVAVKTYCNANVDQTTKQPLVLNVGKAGPSQKQVLYSSDKNFAYVNAACNKDGTIEGSSAAYYLKKVNGTWLFLYRGQMSSPEYTEQFNISSDFN